MKQKKKINQKRKTNIEKFEGIFLTFIILILFIIALNIFGIVIIGVIPAILFFVTLNYKFELERKGGRIK